jgi:hypothetical protein
MVSDKKFEVEGKISAGGVQPWSKGKIYPWTITIEQGGEGSLGAIYAIHPNGGRTFTRYFVVGSDAGFSRAFTAITDECVTRLQRLKVAA